MSCKPSTSTPKHLSTTSRTGFTLAEVVVATLILGLAATVLVQAVTSSLHAYQLSQRDNRGGAMLGDVRRHVLKILSRSALEEGGEMEVPFVTRDADTGDAETELIQVRWEAEIHPTRILDLYILELTANYELDDVTQSVTEEITAYRPTWGESDEVEQLIQTKEQEFAERLSARGAVEEEDDS